jgi:hypothetical protein
MYRVAISLGLLGALLFGCSRADTKGPVLGNPSGFPARYQSAAIIVADEIRRQGEDPREFQVGLEDRGNGELVFQLWHKSAAVPKNQIVLGNPGGKCRNVIYDTKSKRVTQTMFWE